MTVKIGCKLFFYFTQEMQSNAYVNCIVYYLQIAHNLVRITFCEHVYCADYCFQGAGNQYWYKT